MSLIDEGTPFRSTAVIDPTVPPANQYSDYLAKYPKSITAINMTPASFSTVYNTLICITPAPCEDINP